MVETFAFDASEHLDDAAAQIDYLRDAVSTGDAQAIAHALGVVARARGMSQLAQEAGIAREALYRALDPLEGPQIANLGRIAATLTDRFSVAA